ncbi:DUF3727 domain-containing protein [Leptolyngbya sp. FACHB-261]|nr:DUF3727 domain-containing protein [Leptolyngbya sp. FACHB-261]
MSDETILYLKDEAGLSLPCYVERAFEIDGDDYVLLQPVDYPVQIFAWEATDEDENTLADLEDDELAEVFPTAQAVLAEQNLTLKRTAHTLTVDGDIAEPEEEDIFSIETDEDSDVEGEFQKLASFFHEEQEYAVFTALSPLLFFARLKNATQVDLLSPEEFQKIQPMLAMIEDSLFDDEDE